MNNRINFNTCQRSDKSPSIICPGDAPLLEKVWEDSSSNKNGKEKEDIYKSKSKGSA